MLRPPVAKRVALLIASLLKLLAKQLAAFFGLQKVALSDGHDYL